MKWFPVLYISLFAYGVQSQSYEFIDERRYIYNPPPFVPYPVDTTPCQQPYFPSYLPPVELTYEVPNYFPQAIDLRPPCQNYLPPVVDIRPPCQNYLPQVVDIRPPCQSCQNYLQPVVDVRPPCQSCQNYLQPVVDVIPPCQNYLPPVVDIRPPCQCGYQPVTECVKQTIETSYPVDIRTPCQNYLPQIETVTQTIEICTEPALPVDIPCSCPRPIPKPCSCPRPIPKPCSCVPPPPFPCLPIPYIETTLEDNRLSISLANVLQTLIVSKLLSRQVQPSCEVIRPLDFYDYISYDPGFICSCTEYQYPKYVPRVPVFPPTCYF